MILLLLLAALLLTACDPPTKPSSPQPVILQCCVSVNKCSVPPPGATTCRIGVPIYNQE